MFDKERFHNALALLLGYERIVKDKRISIEVEETDDPWVSLKVQGYPEVIRVKASDTQNEVKLKEVPAMQEEINHIVDAVHQAYRQAITNSF